MIPPSQRVTEQSMFPPEDTSRECWFDDETKLWVSVVFPSNKPTGRQDVAMLDEWLTRALAKAALEGRPKDYGNGGDGNNNNNSHLQQSGGGGGGGGVDAVADKTSGDVVRDQLNVLMIGFRELVRQVSTQCHDRGRLLDKIWKSMSSLLDYVVKEMRGTIAACEERMGNLNLRASRHEADMLLLKEQHAQEVKTMTQSLGHKWGSRVEVLKQELIEKEHELRTNIETVKLLGKWFPNFDNYSRSVFTDLLPPVLTTEMAKMLLLPDEALKNDLQRTVSSTMSGMQLTASGTGDGNGGYDSDDAGGNEHIPTGGPSSSSSPYGGGGGGGGGTAGEQHREGGGTPASLRPKKKKTTKHDTVLHNLMTVSKDYRGEIEKLTERVRFLEVENETQRVKSDRESKSMNADNFRLRTLLLASALINPNQPVIVPDRKGIPHRMLETVQHHGPNRSHSPVNNNNDHDNSAPKHHGGHRNSLVQGSDGHPPHGEAHSQAHLMHLAHLSHSPHNDHLSHSNNHDHVSHSHHDHHEGVLHRGTTASSMGVISSSSSSPPQHHDHPGHRSSVAAAHGPTMNSPLSHQHDHAPASAVHRGSVNVGDLHHTAHASASPHRASAMHAVGGHSAFSSPTHHRLSVSGGVMARSPSGDHHHSDGHAHRASNFSSAKVVSAGRSQRECIRYIKKYAEFETGRLESLLTGKDLPVGNAWWMMKLSFSEFVTQQQLMRQPDNFHDAEKTLFILPKSTSHWAVHHADERTKRQMTMFSKLLKCSKTPYSPRQEALWLFMSNELHAYFKFAYSDDEDAPLPMSLVPVAKAQKVLKRALLHNKIDQAVDGTTPWRKLSNDKVTEACNYLYQKSAEFDQMHVEVFEFFEFTINLMETHEQKLKTGLVHLCHIASGQNEYDSVDYDEYNLIVDIVEPKLPPSMRATLYQRFVECALLKEGKKWEATAFAEVVMEYCLPLRSLEIEIEQEIDNMRKRLKSKFDEVLKVVHDIIEKVVTLSSLEADELKVVRDLERRVEQVTKLVETGIEAPFIEPQKVETALLSIVFLEHEAEKISIKLEEIHSSRIGDRENALAAFSQALSTAINFDVRLKTKMIFRRWVAFIEEVLLERLRAEREKAYRHQNMSAFGEGAAVTVVSESTTIGSERLGSAVVEEEE